MNEEIKPKPAELVRLVQAGPTTYTVLYENGAHMGEMYKEIDGYFVYVPTLTAGYWDMTVMLAVADKLIELNKEWDKVVGTDPSVSAHPERYIPLATYAQMRQEWVSNRTAHKTPAP